MKKNIRRSESEALVQRKALLHHMENLSFDGISCKNCTGKCCTFVANSMQITPVEALDLYTYLKDEGRWTSDLKERLYTTIKKHRLDQDVPGNGRRSFMRRYYTCPFFSQRGKGCSIKPEFKPYGCLAFNAKQEGVKDGEHCGSNLEILESVDSEELTDLNAQLSETLGFDWIKKDIPSALLDLDKALYSLS